MKKLIAAAALLGAAGCAAEPTALDRDASSELAAALAGRTAGEPVNCVETRRLRSNRMVDRAAILFDTGGDTVYLNRGGGGCPSLEPGRVLRTQPYTTRLCSGDIVSVFDPVSGTEFGGCALGPFVPYRR